MGLETSTYVNGLNANNPAATDGLAQADDHLRLIKSTIKNTFPNLDAAVTATPAELNVLDGTDVTTASLNKLEDVIASAEELNKLEGTTVTTSEINRLSGVTGDVQTQLNTKAPSASPTFTGTVTLGAFTISVGSDGRLDFKVGSTTVMSLDQSGNLRVKADISAFDTSA